MHGFADFSSASDVYVFPTAMALRAVEGATVVDDDIVNTCEVILERAPEDMNDLFARMRVSN
jgi:hypothetical protein